MLLQTNWKLCCFDGSELEFYGDTSSIPETFAMRGKAYTPSCHKAIALTESPMARGIWAAAMASVFFEWN